MKLSSTGYLIKEGFKNVWNNRMMSLASVAVLISCLIITGAASLISLNVSSLIAAVGDDNELTVYLKYELSDTDSVKIGPQLKKMQGDGNPFGNAYKIRLTDLSKYKSTVKQIKQIDGVDSVSDRSEIAGKLTKLNYFVTLVGFWVVLVLGIVTLFIISNTIKITMYSRRFEISIMKSVGATNAFVRVPFVIEAMLIGLLAGLTASGILIALYNPVKDVASGIVNLIANSTIPVEQLWLPILVSMSVIGMIIGILGGLISITKYLRKEGGEILGW